MSNRYMDKDKWMGLHRSVIDLPINANLSINNDNKAIRNGTFVFFIFISGIGNAD